MGVLVAIFSLISINYQAFAQSEITVPFIVVMNLTMALSIVLMLGVVILLVNKAKSKGFLVAYIVIVLALILADAAVFLNVM